MAQVSKRRLQKDIEAQMYSLLSEAVAACTKPSEAALFLDDLLTETEKTVVAKRLATALLLQKQYTYDQINELLKVSPPTVAKVKLWLRLRGAGYRRILAKIGRHREMEKFWTVVEESVLALRTVKPGSDWADSRRRLEAKKRKTRKRVL